MSDPFFFLWPPDPANDSALRPFQHMYSLAVYSILFALWRFNSLRTLVTVKGLWKQEGGLFAAHYAWFFLCLPLSVAASHVFLAGLMSAVIVTVTHQSEDLFDSHTHDWVEAQLRSTRDATTSNAFSEWLWGGMQYQ